MTNNRFTILGLLLALGISASAQDTVGTRNDHFGMLSLKWAPQQMFAKFPAFQLAAEQRIMPRVALQIESGFVFQSEGLSDRTLGNKRGLKLKFQVRNYFPTHSANWRLFVAPEVGINRINFDDGVTYHVQPANELDYYKYVIEPTRYREVNGSINFGTTFNSARFCLEFQVGVAVRDVRINHPPHDTSYTIFDNDRHSIFDISRTGTTVLPNASFRVGYVVWK